MRSVQRNALLIEQCKDVSKPEDIYQNISKLVEDLEDAGVRCVFIFEILLTADFSKNVPAGLTKSKFDRNRKTINRLGDYCTRHTEPMSSSSMTLDCPGITILTMYTCQSPLRPTKTAAFGNTFPHKIGILLCLS